MSKRNRYDHEFKVQAVKLALEIGQTKACNELKLPENTIYGWMHAYRMGKLDLGSEMHTLARALMMNEELIELRKQVRSRQKKSGVSRRKTNFLRKQALFSLRAVGSWQRREDAFYCPKDLRRPRERKTGILLQNA